MTALEEIYAMGAVRGYRYYNIDTLSDFRYFVGGWRGRWYSPRMKARCELVFPNNELPCPHERHLCGINMYNNAPRRLLTGDLIGLTLGWGKVIEHDDGYRVEHALVTKLIVMDRPELALPEGWKKRGTEVVYTTGYDFDFIISVITDFLAGEDIVEIPHREFS